MKELKIPFQLLGFILIAVCVPFSSCDRLMQYQNSSSSTGNVQQDAEKFVSCGSFIKKGKKYVFNYVLTSDESTEPPTLLKYNYGDVVFAGNTLSININNFYKESYNIVSAIYEEENKETSESMIPYKQKRAQLKLKSNGIDFYAILKVNIGSFTIQEFRLSKPLNSPAKLSYKPHDESLSMEYESRFIMSNVNTKPY